MDNLSDIYYLFQLIVHQIFVFLRDIILHEFPRFISLNMEEADEIGPSKIRKPPMKHVLADFAACFIVCSFLGVLVFLSAKSGKEDEDDEFTDKGIIVDLTEDPIYHLPQTLISKTFKYRYDRGDEYFSEEDESPRKETRYKRDYKSRENSSTSSFFASHSESSQNSQRTEVSERNMKKLGKEQQWLFRKTRSGRVYGKYPL